jgi:hypothetical protein
VNAERRRTVNQKDVKRENFQESQQRSKFHGVPVTITSTGRLSGSKGITG